MRLNVTAGDRQVFVQIKGKSTKKLLLAEQVARRLLDAAPAPEPAKPFGFSRVADTTPADDE